MSRPLQRRRLLQAIRNEAGQLGASPDTLRQRGFAGGCLREDVEEAITQGLALVPLRFSDPGPAFPVDAYLRLIEQWETK